MKAEIEAALSVLKKGGLILYPTDTVWGIGCDATNADAIEKVYKLKKRHESKSLICLVSDFKMLNQFVENIPEVAYDILKNAAKPTTIVYDDPIRVAENLVPEDNTLAIRVVQNDFCKQLIRRFRRPIVSTSANISGEATPASYNDIAPEIKHGVDYIVNWGQKNRSAKASAIIKLSKDGAVQIIRK
ncbi:MAG: threonylcarbamoyl-AMP synthase [Bacteroidia bacterium]|nr:threonylcarbamoyl-AMP synthase [Bacteroidia bacterium]NNF30184.1 threonylcarbamoyl-AMP synthase [Flavobacteriaceae bacterium]MBT8275493.1 threonylcarbamoyl-AMP synthase [Bacteroidia bacterium]NNJ81415.1 threonylcarbamoyl-AMP synthase [Flavobacteriaceae bacterium]NNK54425.1 threonylcarbamoyl-AMP synthase [Flavobacteriaceae bacterium]